MGIEIRAVIKDEPPYTIELRLYCDECPDFFDAKSCMVSGRDFIAMRASATKAGWKETYRNDRRVFLCPDHAKGIDSKAEE